jgi:uncharacterized protein (TIGR02145 family)
MKKLFCGILLCFLCVQFCKENSNPVIPEEATVTDIDGNVYQAVKIGGRLWTTENLKVTHYRDGDPITHVMDTEEWADFFIRACCDYNNDSSSAEVYGRLYSWSVVNDKRGLAPADWRVPTDDDWSDLETALGMSPEEAYASGLFGTPVGGKLKEAGNAHWDPPNTGATNESGLSVLPGGLRDPSDILKVWAFRLSSGLRQNIIEYLHGAERCFPMTLWSVVQI